MGEILIGRPFTTVIERRYILCKHKGVGDTEYKAISDKQSRVKT